MNVPFLNLASQFASLEHEIAPAVLKALAGAHYVLGPNVAELEKEIAAFSDTPFGIGVNSGSDALTLSLKALNIGPGDEVITTPFTYIAPAEAIHQVGARIVFADIDPRTFNLDPAQVARRMSNRTKAIIPVHLFGQAAALKELLAIAEPRGVPIVEDCAQAIGAQYAGRPLGGIGRVGCFSFYPTKNLGAAGDGGMIVTRDEGLAKRLRMLRVHGIERRYHHDLHGFNSRLDELQAVVLRAKLPHLKRWNERRAEIAARYDQGLRELPVELPQITAGNTHVFHVYAILVERRQELQAHLTEKGVATLIYYPLPLHLQKVYADLGFRVGDFPVAERIAETILPLPMYPELTDEQVDYVIRTVADFFQAGK